MRTGTTCLIVTAALACGIASTGPATAHPHIFAEARLDVNVEGGRVGTLHHVWRFDDLFSSTVLVEFDANKDLKLDENELAEIAATVHASLAEYNYFQLVTQDGKDIAMQAPERLIADFTDNQLIILFETRTEEPLLLVGKVAFGIYDPTFYTAIDFTEDDYLAVDGLPADCTRAVVRPDPQEALEQNQGTLTDAFFSDPTGNDLSKIFATRLELTCGQGGAR